MVLATLSVLKSRNPMRYLVQKTFNNFRDAKLSDIVKELLAKKSLSLEQPMFKDCKIKAFFATNETDLQQDPTECPLELNLSTAVENIGNRGTFLITLRARASDTGARNAFKMIMKPNYDKLPTGVHGTTTLLCLQNAILHFNNEFTHK